MGEFVKLDTGRIKSASRDQSDDDVLQCGVCGSNRRNILESLHTGTGSRNGRILCGADNRGDCGNV